MTFLRTTALLAALTLAPNAWAISTVLNYQGSLTDGAAPANGLYDFQFQLTDGAGIPFGLTIPMDDVNVVAGVFTTRIDFSDSFGGADTKLLISVRQGSSVGGYTTLLPATPIDPTPYAQLSAFSEFSATAQTVENGGIIEPKIATGAVSTRTVSDGAITTVKIAPAAVTTSAIADGAVNAQKIASNSVTNLQIADGTINTAELAVNAVTTAEIAPNTVKLVDLDGAEGNVLINLGVSGLLPGVCVDQSASVPGAVVGDYPVLVLQPNAVLPFGMTVTALNTSAVNSVIVRICNFASSTQFLINFPTKIFTLR